MPSPRIQAKRRAPELAQALREKYPDYDPVLAMAEIAVNEEASLGLRASMHREVAQYLYPKLKAVEVDLGAGAEEVVRLVLGAPAPAIDGVVLGRRIEPAEEENREGSADSQQQTGGV